MATKKKYPTVEENLARRKYYTGTRPVATTSNGMGPVYIDTGDGHHNDTAYTPSQPHYFNPNKSDTSGAPTYKAPEAYKAPEPYKAPEAYKAPEPYKAPEAYKAPNFADYQSRDYTTPEFKSGWGDQLQSLYNQIAGRGKFTYDQSKDPLYQQYAEMYRKNAQLAMSDTVAKAASLTGGYGNSYAETAGQSMYNQQMDQLNERALDLYDRALNAWALEGDQLNQRFNMAGQMYNNDYNAWRDQVSDIQRAQEFDYNRYLNDRNFGYDQYINERNFGYDQWRDARDFSYDQYINERNFGYDQWRDARDFGYSQYRDAVGDARWQYETDYGRYRDSVADSQWQQKFDYDKYINDRDYNYQLGRDAIADQRYDTEWQYQVGRDAIADQRYNTEWQYQVGRDRIADERYADETAYNRKQQEAQDKFNYWQAGYDPVTGRMTDEAKARQDAADRFQYWQAGYDPVTGGMSAEARARQDAEDKFNYWQAGYDPTTGTYSKEAADRYKDELNYNYAIHGITPEGELNALGRAQNNMIDPDTEDYTKVYPETSNTKLFKSSVLTKGEFAKRNRAGGVKVDGARVENYDDYLMKMLDSKEFKGMKDKEKMNLIYYYGL